MGPTQSVELIEVAVRRVDRVRADRVRIGPSVGIAVGVRLHQPDDVPTVRTFEDGDAAARAVGGGGRTATAVTAPVVGRHDSALGLVSYKRPIHAAGRRIRKTVPEGSRSLMVTLPSQVSTSFRTR